MADVLHMDYSKRKELVQIQARLTQLDPLLGLERDKCGMSLNKAAITNPFAARRLEQTRADHPAEWEEYCILAEQEMTLLDELGIMDEIMNELFPDERDIDAKAILQGDMFRVVK